MKRSLFVFLLLPMLLSVSGGEFRKKIEVPAGSASSASAVLISRTQKHIRNLAPSGKENGKFLFFWNGLDHEGRTVSAGEYTLRCTLYNGFQAKYDSTPYMPNPNPVYGGDRQGGWLSDLICATAAESLGGAVWIGAPFAAAGDTVMQLSTAGKKLRGFDGPDKSGAWFLRAEGGRMYALAAGGWLGTNLQVSVYEPGKNVFRVLFRRALPRGQFDRLNWKKRPVDGFAVDSNRVLISYTKLNRIDLFSKDGTKERTVEFPAPGAMRYHEGKLYVISRASLMELDLKTGKRRPVISGGLRRPLDFVFQDGKIFVADAGLLQVAVFSKNGKPLGAIGKGFPRKAGKFSPEILDYPVSVAADSLGRIWVCEFSNMPKRISVWSSAGKYICDYNGAGRFNAGGWLNPHDVNYYFSDGMMFRRVRGEWRLDTVYLDLSRDYAKVFEKNAAIPEHPVVYNGKLHLLSDRFYNNSIVWYGRLEFDQVLKPYAAVGCYASIMQLFRERPAGFRDNPADYTFLWVNSNNDTNMSWNELQFEKRPFVRIPWAARMDRDLNFYWLSGCEIRKLAPKPGPMPGYDLKEAKTIRTLVRGERLNAMSPVGGNRLLLNTDQLTCISLTTGYPFWSYPAKDLLNSAGTVSVPNYGFVFLMIGSRQNFLFSSEGVSLGPLNIRNQDSLTGGTFVRGADGCVYFSGGKGADSIYEIKGFEKLKHHVQPVSFSEPERKLAEAARIECVRKTAPEQQDTILLPRMKNGSWNGIREHFCARNGKQLYSYRLAIDGKFLRGEFKVFDQSPFVNNGRDWGLLFKSGDSVSLEFASKNGKEPESGDVRILFAPFRNRLTAVIYRYKVSGADPKKKVEFASASGRTEVDRVEILKNVKMRGLKRPGGYRLEFSVPLAELPPLANDTFYYDAGISFSDDSGSRARFSHYHHSPVKNSMDDIAGEIRLIPSYLWKISREK